jgi:magnesium chelatase subunit D
MVSSPRIGWGDPTKMDDPKRMVLASPGLETEAQPDIWVQDAFAKEDPPNNSFSQEQLEARPFPFGMIVGLDDIKQALILAAVNSRTGGIVISGRRGTGKSVLARAVHRLLPPFIERIKGSPYNVDPKAQMGIDSILQQEIISGKSTLQSKETELVPTPFVQIPLNAMEDSLLGTVDLEKSIQTGKPEFSPGLLARAHRGILYVDEINLLDEEAANVLLNVIADGYVQIEREGLSLKYPCRPLLIATYNPQEGELREHLLDRIGVGLSADMHPLSVMDRVKGVENVLGFSGGTKQQLTDQAKTTLERVEEEERQLRAEISSARSILSDVIMDSAQTLYLCEEATRAGCEGQRAEIFATEVAKASAAVSSTAKNVIVNCVSIRTCLFNNSWPVESKSMQTTFKQQFFSRSLRVETFYPRR